MAKRIRYGVINYFLFNKKKKKLGFDINLATLAFFSNLQAPSHNYLLLILCSFPKVKFLS